MGAIKKTRTSVGHSARYPPWARRNHPPRASEQMINEGAPLVAQATRPQTMYTTIFAIVLAAGAVTMSGISLVQISDLRADGVTGPAGPAGRNGTDGADGAAGPAGADGGTALDAGITYNSTYDAVLMPGFDIGLNDSFDRWSVREFGTNNPDPTSGGMGPVLLLGKMTADGDSSNLKSEGIVVYGTGSDGDPMAPGNWAFARVKPNRFALSNAATAAGGENQNYFRVDNDSFNWRDWNTSPSSGNDVAWTKNAVSFKPPTSITDDTNATSTSTGALVVTGGVGVGGDVHIGGALHVGGYEVGAPYYVQMTFASAAATVFSAASTWTKVALVTTNPHTDSEFTHASNRLTFTGTTDRKFVCSASFSFLAPDANSDIKFGFAVSGDMNNPSEIIMSTGAAGNYVSGTVQTMVDLAENDYVELYASHETWTGAGDTITMQNANVLVTGARVAV